MCDGWESVGDIAARILAAATGREQPPPFGAAGDEHRRSRMEREKGRAPEGAPGRVWGGTDEGGNHLGQDRRSGRDPNTGRPPAGFRAHARN